MKHGLPVFLKLTLFSCRFLAFIIAGIHNMMYLAGLSGLPLAIQNAGDGTFNALQKIWLTRFMRRVISVSVRTPFRNQTLRIVDFRSPVPHSGCVIATCHSPWSRLLVQWCLENHFALIIVTGSTWVSRAKTVNRYGRGYPELHEIVNHLRNGGRLILTADAFIDSKTCMINFFDKICHVSLTPYRLAKLACVPLVGVAPRLSGQYIRVHEFVRFYPGNGKSNGNEVMQSLLSSFEKEIMKSPEAWSTFVMESLSSPKP